MVHIVPRMPRATGWHNGGYNELEVYTTDTYNNQFSTATLLLISLRFQLPYWFIALTGARFIYQVHMAQLCQFTHLLKATHKCSI